MWCTTKSPPLLIEAEFICKVIQTGVIIVSIISNKIADSVSKIILDNHISYNLCIVNAQVPS